MTKLNWYINQKNYKGKLVYGKFILSAIGKLPISKSCFPQKVKLIILEIDLIHLISSDLYQAFCITGSAPKFYIKD